MRAAHFYTFHKKIKKKKEMCFKIKVKKMRATKRERERELRPDIYVTPLSRAGQLVGHKVTSVRSRRNTCHLSDPIFPLN
jgi:hypothetical protein